MTLKVVLFDFNGVIVDDEPIHEEILQSVLLSENIRVTKEDFQRFGLGRSDRACLQDLFHIHGRVVSPDTLTKLLAQKSAAYRQALQALEPLPVFAGVSALVQTFLDYNLRLGIVSGAQRSEVEWVLEQAQLRPAFEVIVTAEDVTTSKPSPEGYLQAISQFNERYPTLSLKPENCLALEDSFPGLEAAHAAQIPVVGVAHTYPFHMMQRRANWAIDGLKELEVPRLLQAFAGGDRPPPSSNRSEAPVLYPQHG